MSESFEYEMHRALDGCKVEDGTDVLTGCYSRVLVNLDRVTAAHEREIAEALCDACDQCDRMDKKAHNHEIEQMRKEIAARYELTHCPSCETRLKTLDVQYEVEHAGKESFHRGYVAGQRSMDADHEAVAMRLRGLRFDGDSHENLSRLAYAIYPCATGWTCESCEGLRDRIIDLLGGVHDGISDCVCGGACDDGCRDSHGQSEAVGVDDSSFTQVMYDVLGNERHKAVCELRKLDGCSPLAHGFRNALAAAIDVSRDDAPYDDKELCHLICDRLIHLLGGDEPYSNLTRTILEPNLPKSAETIKSGGECGGKLMENGENHQIQAEITDELRKFATDPLLGYASQELHVERITAIADRIDERFKRICEQQETVLQKTIEDNVDYDDLYAAAASFAGCDECGEYKQLTYQEFEKRVAVEQERDELQAKLEEADAAIANYREREKSLERNNRRLYDKLNAIREAIDG